MTWTSLADTTWTSLLDRHDPDFAGPTDTWTFHLDRLGHSGLKLDRPALNSLILRKRTIAQPRSTSLTIADPGNDSNRSGPLSLATFIAKRNDRRHSTQQPLSSRSTSTLPTPFSSFSHICPSFTTEVSNVPLYTQYSPNVHPFTQYSRTYPTIFEFPEKRTAYTDTPRFTRATAERGCQNVNSTAVPLRKPSYQLP